MHDHHSHTDHSHHHHHAHGGKDEPQLDYAQKLERRLEHWRHHNEDHLDGYQQWVETSAGPQPPDYRTSGRGLGPFTIGRFTIGRSEDLT